MNKIVAAVGLLCLAGCGSAVSSQSAGPPAYIPVPPTGAPTVTVSAPASVTASAAATPAVPHFDTPVAAMTYLASAWNRGDDIELRHLTDPRARVLLNGMHREATNLRVTGCTKRVPEGDYECSFAHDYPAGYAHTSPVGKAVFLVGPALTPGWYMTVYESCG